MINHNRIQHIDAWRFIAVLLVISHHLVNYSSFRVFSEYIPSLAAVMPALGRFGVLIFFCISGFVICRGLVTEQALTSSVSLAAFFVKRVFRIVPPLAAYLSASAVLSASGFIPIAPIEFLKAAAFVCNFWTCGWYLGHTWSLAFEEQFYLIFPVFFVMVGLRSWPVVILALIASLVAAALLASGMDHTSRSFYFKVFVYMLTGCATALYWPRLQTLIQRLRVATWLAAVTVMFWLAGLVLDGLVPVGSTPLSAFVQDVISLTVLPPLICFVVLGTPVSNRLIKTIFENRTVSYLGKTSYFVYLWQELATANHPMLTVWLTCFFVVAVFCAAHFSYQFFELPLMRVGARISERIKYGVSPGRSLPNQQRVCTMDNGGMLP